MIPLESGLPEKALAAVRKNLPHAEHLPGEFYPSERVRCFYVGCGHPAGNLSRDRDVLAGPNTALGRRHAVDLIVGRMIATVPEGAVGNL